VSDYFGEHSWRLWKDKLKPITHAALKNFRKETKSMIPYTSTNYCHGVLPKDGTGANIWTTESAQRPHFYKKPRIHYCWHSRIGSKAISAWAMRKRHRHCTVSGFPDAVTGKLPSLLLFSIKDRGKKHSKGKTHYFTWKQAHVDNKTTHSIFFYWLFFVSKGGDDTFRLDYYRRPPTYSNNYRPSYGYQTHVQ